MKKTLSIILAAILGLSCFLSCAQTGSEETNEATETEQVITEQGSQAETAETEVPYIESLGAKDFDGAAYSILAVPQGDLPVHAEELTGEGVNDALFERDAAVSDAYNIVIEYPETTATPNNAINVTNSVMAGDTCYDLYLDALSDGKNYMSHAFRNGALYNLIDVPYLNLDQAWWSELMYDKLQYKGKMYFTSGDIATASYYAPSCVFMNLAVLKNHNLDENEIYELVYDNAWTIDEVMKRTEGLKTDLDGDGKITPANDSYGIVSATVELTSTQICVGAGLKYCDIDEEGKLVVNLNTEEVIDTIGKLRQCFCEVRQGDDWSPIFDTFKIDRELFLVHFVGSALSFRDMESDFAVLPMPKINAEQASYMSYTNPHTVSYIAIPLIQDNIERTGFIAEVLEYISVEKVRPAIYERTLKGKAARNVDTQAMLDIVFNTAYIDFNALNNFGSTTQTICNALFGDADYVSSYARIAKMIDKELEKFESIFD